MARRLKKAPKYSKRRGLKKKGGYRKGGKRMGAKRYGGKKLSIKRYTAAAPFGDRVYATLKFVSSANLVPSAVGSSGIFATSIIYNDLSAYVATYGLAPGVIDYANIFLDYRILNVKWVMDYYPSSTSEAAQVMFGWQGQAPLTVLNFREALEKNFLSYKNVETAGSGRPTRMTYKCGVRAIDSGVNTKVLEYSGQLTPSSPYATSPQEIARFACGMIHVGPTGYTVTTAQGVFKVTAYVEAVFWNRRQQSHI